MKKGTLKFVLAVLFLLPVCAKATIYEWTSGTYEITIVDDYSADWINLSNSAVVNMTGGRLGVLNAYNTSTFNLQNGDIGSILQFYGTSTANISGGVITGGFTMHDNTILNISGGNLSGSHIGMGDSTILNLSGGNFGTGNLISWISVKNIVNVYARDLIIVPYNNADKFASGHWADGTSFQFVLARAQVYDPLPQIIFHEIPEPCTFGLIGIGFFLLKRRI